jgi:transposase-like protein
LEGAETSVKAKPKKRSPGRPTIYSAEVAVLLADAYASGVSLVDAARSVGIGATTVKAWYRESREKPDGPKGNFGPMMRAALSKSIVSAAKEKRKFDPGWFLARMRPRRFGDPAKRVELSGKLDVTAGVRQGQFEADIERILKLKPHVPGSVEVIDEPVETDD